MRGIDIWNTAGIGYWGDGDVTANVITLEAYGEAVGDFAPVTLPVGSLVPAARRTLALYPNTQAAPYIRAALAQNDPGALDAEAGDMIVQVAAFGRIVYG